MSNIVKTILVVEDEADWKDTITEYCQEAHEKLYGNGGKILTASNASEAINLLEKHPIHFVSVDLNLKGDKDVNLPGGLQVLREIYDKKLNISSIVVSGQRAPKFPAISKKYGALTFQEKNNPEFEKIFITAVKAALVYTEAREFLNGGIYGAALAKWREAINMVKQIEENIGSVEDWSFPLDIGTYLSDFKHPITHLPTSRLIEAELSKLLSEKEWLLFYLEIEHLDAFADSQGHLQRNTLLETTRDLIGEIFAEQISKSFFLGQTDDNIFVIAVSDISLNNEQVKVFIQKIKTGFDEKSLPHYDEFSINKEMRQIKYEDKYGNECISPFANLNVSLVRGQKSQFRGSQLEKSGVFKYGDIVEYGNTRDIDKAARDTLHLLTKPVDNKPN